MAFFCPIRVRKGKKKKENDLLDGRAPTLGRITGSSSIETLVKVGLEKENHGIGSETKMIVLHDFTPCVDDELEVKRGQIVNVLYQENDWVYVIAENNNNAEGFIPFSYCTPLSSPLAELVKHKKLPRTTNNNLANSNKNPMDTGQVELQDTDTYSSIATSDIHPFFKDPSGKYVVLYTFIARDENDVSVERGEFVTVLNKDDHDWYWIIRSDGHEGFVPSAFVCPLEVAFGKHKHHQQLQPQQQGVLSITSSNAITNGMSNGNNSTGINLTGHVLGETTTNNSSNNTAITTTTNTSQSTINGLSLSSNGHNNASYINGNIINNLHHTTTTNGGVSTLEESTTYSNSMSGNSQGLPMSGGVVASHDIHPGTELVMLYDYKAQAPDDLNVRRGDWIYADLTNQTIEGWLWAYAPKLRKYGFIPKAYARPPAMTSI